jgi:hypothetical protein
MKVATAEFAANLAFGKIAESLIAKWLIRKGIGVLPVYEKELDHGKGPQLFTNIGSFVAPDICAIKWGEPLWIEAKHKSVFTWYRNGRPPRWETGIDLNHWQDYIKATKFSGWQTFLLFLHEESTPDERDRKWGCPEQCPVGLFGHRISYLIKHVSHTSPNWGRHGMVYWAQSNLLFLASVEEVKSNDPIRDIVTPSPRAVRPLRTDTTTQLAFMTDCAKELI